MKTLFTIQEVAAYLNVTERTVYRFLWNKSLKGIKVGHQWRIGKSDIDDLLNDSPYKYKEINQKANILVVDDEDTVLLLIKEILADSQHNVIITAHAQDGLKLLEKNDFDLIFVDLKMPKIDGAEFIRLSKKLNPTTPIIIVTGYPNEEIMNRAIQYGPFGIIKKPFTRTDILNAVKLFLKTRDIKDE